MPRKNAMRDNVSAVRSHLPDLVNLPREKIELALLYYESNVDETVEAFKRDGAIEALSGWTEMNNGRGNSSTKRTNNKSGNKSSSQTPPSNTILRPSQRVSNIFQTFAEGGIPATTTTTITSSPSFVEPSNHTLQSYPSTDLSFHPCLSQDSTINTSESLLNAIESNPNEFHDTSNATTNSSITTTSDEMNLLTNQIDREIDVTNGHDDKPKRRRSIRDRNGSTSSNHHQQTQPSESTDIQQSTTVIKSSSNTTTASSNNRKILTKSTKDLQRQTSTLTNVELSYENEIKSSMKHIDDVFQQLRNIIKEREVELYLEMDKVKEHGLNIIHRRQQRASELRQRVDHCDRLEPLEIDNLRTDIKQFVTDRRYDLGEELTSSHRFEYDQTLIEALKTFGTVLRIDRKHERSRTLSTSSALVDQKGGSATTTTTTTTTTTAENSSTPLTNGRMTSNEIISPTHHHQALPQRINPKQNFNGNNAGDYYQNSHPSPQTNGFYQYYDESYNYQTVNHRRRPQPPSSQQQQQQQQQHNGNGRRARPPPSTNNNPPRRNGLNNSETSNTYRRPRPSPQPIVPPISN